MLGNESGAGKLGLSLGLGFFLSLSIGLGIGLRPRLLGKTSIKKNVFFRALPELWGGVYPCPNFWSIKGVFLFKNANVLNF